MSKHPFKTGMLDKGIKVTFSPDDPGLFRYWGVSPDYYMASLSQNLELETVLTIVKNGIDAIDKVTFRHKQQMSFKKDIFEWMESNKSKLEKLSKASFQKKDLSARKRKG